MINIKRKVAILMSTYNGEKYIKEQIESILKQERVDVHLYIRDDGSTDNTVTLLKKYKYKSNIEIIYGDNIGFQRSFMYLVKTIPDEYDYYAFSDQDDYWKQDKLLRAIEKFEKDETIDLYVSSLDVVNEKLEHQYYNEFPHLRISFGSALSRQRLAGCTMVFTRKILNLSKMFPINEYYYIFSHDAIVYYLTLLTGSRIYFDKRSYILFRRHAGTVTEHGQGLIKRIKSVTSIFSKNKSWKYKQTKVLLSNYKLYMTEEVKEYCYKISKYKSSILNTLDLFFDSRIDSGVLIVDLINKISILFRCY